MNEQSLDSWFQRFIASLKEGGWEAVFQPHGWDLDSGSSQQQLSVDREQLGFEDFAMAGEQAIQPGDPALSLLFHAVLSAGVVTDGISNYPSLIDIDNLENYIYSLSPLTKEQSEQYTAVVVTSEYRAASTTPHKAHADMLYSRTGLGRVGSEAAEYDPQRRCFTTKANEPGATRVQPVRYSVYLCEAQHYNNDNIGIQGAKHSKDETRTFWLPKHKLFNGSECITGCDIQLAYQEKHENEKLRRMVTHGGLKLAGDFDINQPPFYYVSDKHQFLTTTEIGSSWLVERDPGPFVDIAKQNGNIVTFKVPPITNKWLPYNNRRYTSLRVGQKILWAGLDYALSWVIGKLGSDQRTFLSPRRCGEFTNIRHVVDQNGEVKDLNLVPGKTFLKTNRAGNYNAIMHQDGISEGVVGCTVTGLGIDLGIDLGIGLGQSSVKALPAWSLMTAPDFMPRVGNIDIYKHKENFTIGGPRALCEGRLAINSRLKTPDDQSQAFSRDENTLTAVVCAPRPNAVATRVQPAYDVTHVLTDHASDIFAPGWEVTYNRDSLLSYPYYHTSGLGSPFLEDVKLCAAANGMWPAASPDAARTFKRKTRTALPLTDEEIGLAADSALVQRGHPGNAGWDGENGPYITVDEGRWKVNYSGINRSDYVSNGLAGKVNFSNLRPLNEQEADLRMDLLQQTNTKILNGTELSDSPFWLVAFQKIADWQTDNNQFNVPDELLASVQQLLSAAPVDEPGYFMVFAKYSAESTTSEVLKRRLQAVDSLTLVKAIKGQQPAVLEVKAA